MDVLSSRVLVRPTDPEASRAFYRDVLELPELGLSVPLAPLYENLI